MMNDPILSCRGLVKYYGGQPALVGIDLNLNRGKVIGLLGPNGSGKTTLLKLAMGLLTPSEGFIGIDGLRPGAESRALVSYLPDADYLPGHMKIRDLVAMFRDFYSDFDERKAIELLSDLGIHGTARLKELSKGTREKVQLVLCMSRRARLYLLDEPLGGVDPAGRDYILSTILRNFEPGATVLISTHLLSDVENVLDEVVLLAGGRVLAYRDVRELRETEGKSVDDYFREVFKC